MRETGTHLWCVARFDIICTILKNVKNTHGGVLLLLKLQASFSKLDKWYQIAQRITFVSSPLVFQGLSET